MSISLETRSMRENPTPHADPTQQTYAGDNFVRHTGEYKDFTQVQRFAWDAARSAGGEAASVVPIANPSQVRMFGLFFFFLNKHFLRVFFRIVLRNAWTKTRFSFWTKAELLHRQFREKKATLQQRRRAALLDKYGGAEHLDAGGEAHEAQLAATEHYVEYDAEGRVIKGLEKAKARSKYDEDIYPQNHQSVWGSYWRDGQWGYAW